MLRRFCLVFVGVLTLGLVLPSRVPTAAATVFDGYPMAQKGMAGKALAIATAAHQRGCTGAVVDGGVRNTSFILDMNFPVFCRFKCSASSIGRWSIREFQVPIEIGQTQIIPGDFIMGDIDGVIAIPQAVAYDILTEAEEISVRERKMRAELRKGVGITEVYKKYGSF